MISKVSQLSIIKVQGRQKSVTSVDLRNNFPDATLSKRDYKSHFYEGVFFWQPIKFGLQKFVITLIFRRNKVSGIL